MKKVFGIYLLLIVAFVYIILQYQPHLGSNINITQTKDKGCYYNLSNNITLYSLYCLEELKDIPIIIENDLVSKNYNVSILFYDPLGIGYYTASLLELMLKLGYTIRITPVCLYNESGCKLYSLLLDENYYYIFDVDENITFIVPSDSVLAIFVLQNETNGVIIKNNKVYIVGKDEGIRKAASKFILWWYDIENS